MSSYLYRIYDISMESWLNIIFEPLIPFVYYIDNWAICNIKYISLTKSVTTSDPNLACFYVPSLQKNQRHVFGSLKTIH